MNPLFYCMKYSHRSFYSSEGAGIQKLKSFVAYCNKCNKLNESAVPASCSKRPSKPHCYQSSLFFDGKSLTLHL